MSNEQQQQTPAQFVVTMEGDIHGEDTPENREIVRRIHACWNACEGISTEELENNVIADMRSVIANIVPVLQGKAEKAAETSQIKAPNILKDNKSRAGHRHGM